MGRGRTKTSDPTTRGWETAGGRVRWLLHEKWAGNCSAMARAIGVSHTERNKIGFGGREPGRRVLEAVAAYPRFNPVWILSGQGEPMLEAPRPPAPIAVPIAESVLPGPLHQHPDLL